MDDKNKFTQYEDIKNSLERQYDLKKIVLEKHNEFISLLENKIFLGDFKKVNELLEKQIYFFEKLNIYIGEKEIKEFIIDIDEEINNFKVLDMNLFFSKEYIEDKYSEYIEEMIEYALSNLNDGLGWLNDEEEDDEYYMYENKLNDAKDLLEVAYFLYIDCPAQAHEKADHLDTYIREGFSESFWTDFILNNELEDLKKYENIIKVKNNLEIILPNKNTEVKKNKI